MAEIPTVYTIDEAAQLLKVNAQAVVDEINAGYLEGFRVGGQWRTTDKSITGFISRGGSQDQSKQADRGGICPGMATALKRVDAFSYEWPNGTIEEYHEAYEGIVETDSAQIQAKIGIGERAAAGKMRKRVVVFLDGRPTVEFAGADDFDKSGLVASVITGPHAMSAMGALTKINDFDTMISHALIRAKFRDQE
jgi:excisionase family DNA binding protein